MEMYDEIRKSKVPMKLTRDLTYRIVHDYLQHEGYE